MKTRMIIVALMLATISMSSMAQKKNDRFGLEIRPGVSFATAKLGDATLKPGIGAEGTWFTWTRSKTWWPGRAAG